MNESIPIEERVIERAMVEYPDIAEIVDFSTPVVSFGNPNLARVATLGINPSSNEFQIGDGDKRPLGIVEKKRLIDTEVLGISKPKALNREQAIEVVTGCYNYFLGSEANPYKWFKKLEGIVLNPAGYSYYDSRNLACHLDLVQWATDPVWSKIKQKRVRDSLLLADKEFLRYQLTSYKFEYVFLNGGLVLEQFKRLDITNLKQVESLTRNAYGGKHQVLKGKRNGTTFLGWGINVGARDANKSGLSELAQMLSNLDSL